MDQTQAVNYLVFRYQDLFLSKADAYIQQNKLQYFTTDESPFDKMMHESELQGARKRVGFLNSDIDDLQQFIDSQVAGIELVYFTETMNDRIDSKFDLEIQKLVVQEKSTTKRLEKLDNLQYKDEVLTRRMIEERNDLIKALLK